MIEEIKQGDKQTDVGVIPEDWGVNRLVDIGSFSRGSGIRKKEHNHSKKFYDLLTYVMPDWSMRKEKLNNTVEAKRCCSHYIEEKTVC